MEDIFDELMYENKRLFDELLFSNKCLNKLIEFKINFDLHSKQFKSSLDSNDWLKFERLLDEFNGVVVKLNIRPKLPINSTVVSTEQLNTSSEASVKSFIELPVEFTDKTQKNGLTEDLSDTESGTLSADYEDAISVDNSEYDAKEVDLIPENILEENFESNNLFQDIDDNSDEEYVPNGERSADQLIAGSVEKPKKRRRKRKKTSDSPKYRNLSCDWTGCQFVGKDKTALTRHIYCHTKEHNFICNRADCQYTTYRKDDLRRHLMVHTRREGKEFNEPELFPNEFGCLHIRCGKYFLTKEAFDSHLAGHKLNLFFCEFPGCDFSDRTLKGVYYHKRKHSDRQPKIVECPECGKQSKNDYCFKNHFERMHKLLDQPMVCDIDDCNKEFATESSFRQHQKNVHNREKQFICQYSNCDYKSAMKNAYKQHMASHSDYRPFKCPIDGCDKSFKLKVHLKPHVDLHSTECKYKCPHEGCGMAYKTRVYLYNHEKNHHKEKPFKCDWPGCEYRSAQQSWLNYHSAVHQNTFDVSCIWPNCDKKFRSSKSMRSHLKVHKRDKRHVCPWPGCNYQCITSCAMKSHMSVHSTQKPVVCDWPDCNKKFKRESGLKIHLMGHQGIKNHQCPWPGCQYRAKTNGMVKNHIKVHQKQPKRK